MTPLPTARAGGEDEAPIGRLAVVRLGDDRQALEESLHGGETQEEGEEDTHLSLEEVRQGMVLPAG